ncbi:MAG: histidine phosphatase family protein [Candidatus Levybacteria bacterium]|nr:histidine phosphatase family protein [Candidatus Levybacteria bacterium]
MDTTKQYCTIYIVRHGETTANASGILGLDTDLTEKGKQQASSLRDRFKNIAFAAVYASDLVRTQQTAEILNLERKLAVNVSALIRERNYGSMEGSDEEIYKKRIREYLTRMEALSDEERWKFRFLPDMETEEEAVSRFIRFAREVAVAYSGKHVLLVSHGNVMRTFLIHLGFATYRELPTGSIENTGYIKLRSDGVDFFIDETVRIHKSNG